MTWTTADLARSFKPSVGLTLAWSFKEASHFKSFCSCLSRCFVWFLIHPTATNQLSYPQDAATFFFMVSSYSTLFAFIFSMSVTRSEALGRIFSALSGVQYVTRPGPGMVHEVDKYSATGRTQVCIQTPSIELKCLFLRTFFFRSRFR